MHDAAHRAVLKLIEDVRPIEGWSVLDLGGADINGTMRSDLERFKVSRLDVLDIEYSPNVTILADARTYRGAWTYDMVLSTELLEHCDWRDGVLDTVFIHLKHGGYFIGSAASFNRPRHGARGAAVPDSNEHYENVAPSELRHQLLVTGFVDVEVEYSDLHHAVYWSARRP